MGRLLGPKMALVVFRTQQRTTASGLELRFHNPELYQLSYPTAAICYYLSNHPHKGRGPNNTTSELAGLSSTLISLMLNVKQGSCGYQLFKFFGLTQ